MNQNKIMTYSIEESNQDTIYYSMPENATETEIHMIFKSDEQSINKMQYSANALSTDKRKVTVILSPITKAEIEDAVQNYQKEKIDKVVEKLNQSVNIENIEELASICTTSLHSMISANGKEKEKVENCRTSQTMLYSKLNL